MINPLVKITGKNQLSYHRHDPIKKGGLSKNSAGEFHLNGDRISIRRKT